MALLRSWTKIKGDLYGNIYSEALDQELVKMAEVQASPVEVLGSNEVENRHQSEVAVLERKPLPKLEPKAVQPTDEICIKEYAELAKQVGLEPTDLVIEEFKAFLNKHDIPVFNLQEVIAYMDEKAKQESKDQLGWWWRPLRKKDLLLSAMSHFGIPNRRVEPRWTPASDFYGGGSDGSRIYDKIIPLHALKKVALIEKEFSHQVAMFVCDYAPLPALNPDPFLMAVINNPRLNSGEGRFCIDFWNEPGFGLTSQLK